MTAAHAGVGGTEASQTLPSFHEKDEQSGATVPFSEWPLLKTAETVELSADRVLQRRARVEALGRIDARNYISSAARTLAWSSTQRARIAQ